MWPFCCMTWCNWKHFTLSSETYIVSFDHAILDDKKIKHCIWTLLDKDHHRISYPFCEITSLPYMESYEVFYPY